MESNFQKDSFAPQELNKNLKRWFRTMHSSAADRHRGKVTSREVELKAGGCTGFGFLDCACSPTKVILSSVRSDRGNIFSCDAHGGCRAIRGIVAVRNTQIGSRLRGDFRLRMPILHGTRDPTTIFLFHPTACNTACRVIN